MKQIKEVTVLITTFQKNIKNKEFKDDSRIDEIVRFTNMSDFFIGSRTNDGMFSWTDASSWNYSKFANS